ncbi:hypothetical protein BJQ94_14545 [Cryobacterium sp. SO2]|uniref:hypothetical protein n=1 Tax=Cryobacterium sp. SO2 TaxID=1897060 RepID=UPI00223D6CFF|nr:hypothetical protein [Cryobacterium sp. SO2]WEO76571.1 hypothetical protein BJQ94_14545 [Cryobacterium sp. SO2]
MRNKKNDEPRDEFDHIMIPAFIARPFERLGSRPLPAAPSGRPDNASNAASSSAPTDQRSADAPDGADADATDAEQPAPRAWWAGYRGKMLLYGAGTLVMVFLQSRG